MVSIGGRRAAAVSRQDRGGQQSEYPEIRSCGKILSCVSSIKTWLSTLEGGTGDDAGPEGFRSRKREMEIRKRGIRRRNQDTEQQEGGTT